MKGSNSTLKDRGFIVAGGDLVWQEVHHHKLEETGCVYVTVDPTRLPKEDVEHMVYKLSKIPFDRGEPEPEKPYFWSALWNSCTHSGHKERDKWVGHYTTIEDAIRAKMNAGWAVRMTTWSELFPHGIKFEG